MDKDKALNERRNRKKGALTFAGYRLRTRSRQPGGGVKDRYTLDQGDKILGKGCAGLDGERRQTPMQKTDQDEERGNPMAPSGAQRHETACCPRLPKLPKLGRHRQMACISHTSQGSHTSARGAGGSRDRAHPASGTHSRPRTWDRAWKKSGFGCNCACDRAAPQRHQQKPTTPTLQTPGTPPHLPCPPLSSPAAEM
jgi:hypothetical protein